MPILGLAPSTKPVHPAHFNIEAVIRPNILSLKPYRCARDDYQSGVLLDANENAFGSVIMPSSAADLAPEVRETTQLNLHRYPDPSHPEIKARIAELRGLPGTDRVFLGVGSDEIIDLLIRICVAPGKEQILTTPPTYGMYGVCAQVNDVGVVRVPLEASGANGEGGEKGRFSVKIEEVGICFLRVYVDYSRTILRSKQQFKRTPQSNSSSYAHRVTLPARSFHSQQSANFSSSSPTKDSSSLTRHISTLAKHKIAP